jgi:hypothetical protein
MTTAEALKAITRAFNAHPTKRIIDSEQDGSTGDYVITFTDGHERYSIKVREGYLAVRNEQGRVVESIDALGDVDEEAVLRAIQL